jgi:plastocyanin
MSRFPRVLVALAFGFVAPILPVTVHAGGGPAGVPAGGGFAGGAAASVEIDNANPPGHNWGYLDFFPRTITVHQGDAVTFWHAPNPTEPHTVTFVPAGLNAQQALARLIPGGGNPIPDTDDGPRAGPYLPFNVHTPRGCGNSPFYPGTGACPFTGRTVLNSGLLVPTGRGSVPSFTARMDAAPGIYRYFCLVHGPAMSGTVRVVPASAPVPSAAQNATAAAQQRQVATTNALAHEATLTARSQQTQGGHTAWTVHTGGSYGRVFYDEFIPANLQIKPGDTVNWPPEFHTVTFGGPPNLDFAAPACEAPGRDRPFTGSFSGCDLELGLNLMAAFPSGPPGRPYTGGFYNSGILVLPRPRSWSASFPTGGTFMYRCVVHPGMRAVITVR